MTITLFIIILIRLCHGEKLIPPFAVPDPTCYNHRDCFDDKTTTSTDVAINFTFPVEVFNKTRFDEIIKAAKTREDREIFEFTPDSHTHTPTTVLRGLHPQSAEGVFFNFTLALYNSILKLRTGKISSYLKVLAGAMRFSSYRRRWPGSYLKFFMKRLARRTKLLSRYKVSRIKDKVSDIINDTLEAKPMRIAFFKEFNSLFNLRDTIKFDSYAHFVRIYGKGRESLRFIRKKTKKIMNYIFYVIYKQKEDVMNRVIKKLMLAYKEYYST